MQFKKLFTALIVVLLTSCMNGSLSYHEGIKSFQVQDYRRAFIRLLPEAKKGHPDAQYAVGYMYYYGEGVVEDRKKAKYWICLAAKAGQPDAVEALKILKN